MSRYACAVLWLAVAAGAAPAAAQNPDRLPPILVQTVPAPVMGADAQSTREQLQQVLRQYPRAVGEVLARDPSLMGRADYMASYPALVAFLQQHPDVARNPGFYFEYYRQEERFERSPQERAWNASQEVLFVFLGALAVSAVFGILMWLVRTVIDHRRWLRVSRVQTEVHTKLLDRLTNNEDLLAYIQSPAGRRFLESAPLDISSDTRAGGAPYARIIWSLQAGVVLISIGGGLWLVQYTLATQVAPEAFVIVSAMTGALGVGFVLSALVAYIVSARLGLLAPPRAGHA